MLSQSIQGVKVTRTPEAHKPMAAPEATRDSRIQVKYKNLFPSQDDYNHCLPLDKDVPIGQNKLFGVRK